MFAEMMRKNKKGIIPDSLAFLIVALLILVLIIIGIVVLKVKGINALDYIKNLFRSLFRLGT